MTDTIHTTADLLSDYVLSTRIFPSLFLLELVLPVFLCCSRVTQPETLSERKLYFHVGVKDEIVASAIQNVNGDQRHSRLMGNIFN